MWLEKSGKTREEAGREKKCVKALRRGRIRG